MERQVEDGIVTEQSAKQSKRQSLAKRFNQSLILMYVFTVLVTTPVIYYITKQQVYNRAEQELVLLVDVVKSIQSYVANDLRPHFMKEKIFYSPSFSGIAATSRVAKYLKQEQPQYYISNVSDNPLNPNNKVQGLEEQLLSRFRNNRHMEMVTTSGEIDGKHYLVSSAPKVSKKGCLRCHGIPEQAPMDVKATYGTESGFGYQAGDVVGVSVVGVPLEDVQSLTIQRSLIVIGAITLLFSALFFVVNRLVRGLILEPISEITTVATAVSRGDISREMHVQDRKDEIAELANAFELMRRSLVAAMKRMKRKS
jgi:HAMP domain-containing protein